MLSRLKIVDALVNEGFSHKTLSLFSDSQIKALGKKLLSERAQSEIMYAQAALQARAEKLKDAFDSGMASVQAGQEALSKQVASESSDVENNKDVKTVDTDNMGNPDVDIKKPNKKKEKLINDKKDVEEDVTSEMVENWMTQVVTKKEKPLSKAKLIEMVKNIQEDDMGDRTKVRTYSPYDPGQKRRTKLFASVEQEYAFEQLNKYVLDLEGYEIMVDELERGEDPEESILNLFLASDAGFTWDIMIYTDGNIYMDGAPIQDSQDLEEEIREKESGGENFFNAEELSETERDNEGVYIGAPVGTEMPVKTPVRTPTTTPTTPKRRRGPFTRPKTTPKPKAGKDEMPDWMGFDDIKSQTENS
tara:strand:- start:1962 stop:3044 length:1083 start_codon:yes stop_codon:yes gene_type:complete